MSKGGGGAFGPTKLIHSVLGLAGRCYSVWGKPVQGRGGGGGGGSAGSSSRAWAVTALNSAASVVTIELELSELGLAGKVTETEVWSDRKSDVSGGTWRAVLPAGGHRFVLFEEA